MKTGTGRIFGFAVAAALVATPASAQIAGQPVYVNPAAGMGVTLAFDYAKGDANAGDLTSIGGHATLGAGIVTVSAGAASVNTSPESKIGFGGNASLNLIKLPMITIAPFAGFGTISLGNNVSQQYVPLGAAIAVAPPALPISVWAAPRADLSISKVSGTSTTSTNFGVSGGVDLTLPIGLGAHVAVDYIAVDGGAPFVWGVGAHYTIGLPGM